MSKKSAASKGYRRTEKNKPFLSKKEIIALVVIIAVIAAAMLVINAIPNLGTIPASQVKAGDIISRANVESKGRYVKVGEIGQIEGFTMESSTGPDSPVSGYRFYPDEPMGGLDHVSVGGAIQNHEQMSSSMLASCQASATYSASEALTPAVIAGRDANLFTVCYASYDESKDPNPGEGDPTVEKEPNSYTQYIYCYADAGNYSLSLKANIFGSDASVFIPQEEIVDYMSQFGSALKPSEK